MAKEIEVKILEINKKETVAALKKMGAKKRFDSQIEALYYDLPNGALRKNGTVFRLRKVGKKTELTLKQMISKKGIRVMEEGEVVIKSFAKAKKTIDALGLKVVKRVRKRRISYGLGKTHFELDKFPGIPLFLEIESPSQKSLKQTVARLGYTMKQTKTWTTFDVLKYYKK